MSIEKIPYFCPRITQDRDKKNGDVIEHKCGKIMRPFDVFAFEKVGMCLDCLTDVETHIRITGAPELNEEYKKLILGAYEEIMKENEGKDFQQYK